MTHLTQLQFSMFADGVLADDDLKLVEQHLAGCADCRTQLDTNTNENQLIKAAMLFDDGVIVQVAPVPKFSKRISLREFAIANLLTGLSIWLVQFLWKSLFGELISELAFNAFTWVTLIPVPDLFELILGFAQYFTQEGTTMIYAYIGFVVATLLVAILTWFAFSNRKTRSLMSFGLGITLVGSLLIPSPADALEFRRGDTVTIESNETVDDTLLVGGDTVVVDGHVTGDLIVVGERLVMNGIVDGNLVIIGESVSVQGQVGGFLLAAGASVGVAGATIGGDLWSAGESVNVDKATQVGRNAAIAGEKISMSGDVKQDFYAAGGRIELNGNIGEDFEVFTERVHLLGNANVGGNMRIRADDESVLQRSSSAVVQGEVEFLTDDTKSLKRNRYLTGGFYLLQLALLLSAFVIGVFVFWLFPSLRDVTLEGGVDGLKTAGMGLVALVSLPVILLLFAVTLIGLPFTVFGFFSWLFAIYFAKILLALLVGGLILGATEKRDSMPLALLAGLTAISVVVNMPFIGGILNFVLTIIGIGLLLHVVLTHLSNLNAGEIA